MKYKNRLNKLDETTHATLFRCLENDMSEYMRSFNPLIKNDNDFWILLMYLSHKYPEHGQQLCKPETLIDEIDRAFENGIILVPVIARDKQPIHAISDDEIEEFVDMVIETKGYTGNPEKFFTWFPNLDAYEELI